MSSNIRRLIACAIDSGPVFRVSSEKNFIENRWEGWVRIESTLWEAESLSLDYNLLNHSLKKRDYKADGVKLALLCSSG